MKRRPWSLLIFFLGFLCKPVFLNPIVAEILFVGFKRKISASFLLAMAEVEQNDRG
ncbi:MAG: hypothetical protein ABWZ79_08160 [Pedobacter agri]